MIGGVIAQYQKPNLSPSSEMRWGAIANRLMSAGNPAEQAAHMANAMTRESIARRLNLVQQNSYIQPVGE